MRKLAALAALALSLLTATGANAALHGPPSSHPAHGGWSFSDGH
ncbi:MAG TPA: hypothetical protein VE088_07905 [Gaiellaceae bacterium]|nr:hypothetical protein [Gaiellaceae bacterium]